MVTKVTNVTDQGAAPDDREDSLRRMRKAAPGGTVDDDECVDCRH
jgi:hypothetical protein